VWRSSRARRLGGAVHLGEPGAELRVLVLEPLDHFALMGDQLGLQAAVRRSSSGDQPRWILSAKASIVCLACSVTRTCPYWSTKAEPGLGEPVCEFAGRIG
jgi:hypothetical protein